MNFEEKFTWICPICKVRFHLHQLISIKPFRARKYILNRVQRLLNKENNKGINIRNLKNEINSEYLKKENILNDMYKSIQVNNDSVLSNNRKVNLKTNTTNTNENNETEVQLFSDNEGSFSNDKIFRKFKSLSIEDKEENNERNSEKIYFGLKSELIHKSHKEKSRHYKTLLDIMEKRKKKRICK